MSSGPETSIKRRRVLFWGAATAAAGVAGGIGWQFRPTIPPEFPEMALDDAPPARPKLLVVYASRYGSTAEQAMWIGEAAVNGGFAVQVSRAEDAPRLDGFDAVILGSAIRSSAWLPEAVQWAADNRTALAQKPHALFQASMTVAGILRNSPDHALGPEHTEVLSGYLSDLLEAVPALASARIAHLPGCLDYEKLSPAMRLVFPIAAGSLDSGDFRDRQMVRDFTTSVVETFAA